MKSSEGYRELELPGRFPTPPDLTIRFAGREYGARSGESLALSLLANGIYLTGRSVKYHRPRGSFCGRGTCGHCTARIDGDPNLRLCSTPARPGSTVETQNVVGTARYDLLSSIDWLFPGGIDHHRLMTESTTLNRVAVSMARELSGLGQLPDLDDRSSERELESLNVEVAIVGAGEAGKAVANATNNAGLKTLLLDGDLDAKSELLRAATVIGFYDDDGLLAVDGDRLLRVRADAYVLATGAHEQLPDCPGNDLPGILARRFVERALAHGILPGRRVVLAIDPRADRSTRQRSVALAERLAEAGVHVEAVLGVDTPTVAKRTFAASLSSVTGRSHVRRVQATGDDTGLDCDALIWCGRAAPAYELARQMGLEAPFSEEVGGFVPLHNPDGSTDRAGLFVAGELTGNEADAAAEHGARVGKTVESYLSARAGESD